METYIVKDGDTIVSIARKFNIRVVDLVDANQLENQFFLESGVELIIPTTMPAGFSYYTVVKGDNLYQIAGKFGITDQVLAQLNGLDLSEYIYPGQKLIVPQKGNKIYFTQENDRLNDIAESLGLTNEEIVYFNPNLYLLPDQVIVYRETGTTSI
ncbi:MAG: LysM peptidoglycan-binding domain-containing protein [bacterium]|nr:LysM peptidoglycan-binding domain-containing protein [bacterium]